MARRFPFPFPLRSRKAQLPLWAVIILIAVSVWQAYRSPPSRTTHAPRDRPSADHSSVPDGPEMVRVKRVVDGDTLLLEDGRRVRLLGVDTPETKRPDTPVQPWGPEASAFTKQHVAGQSIRLEFDREQYDKYDRLLAYVYLGDWFLNEELIRAGLSPAVTRFPYSPQMKQRFRAAEDEARRNKRGIWSGAP